MYLEFFGLEREPFHITPDPEFLFPSPSHKEAFATVMYGVQQQKGFVVVTGEVGTGKTTVLRAYLQKLKGSDIQPIYIFDPHLAFDELLEAVMAELGAPPHEGHSQFSRLQWLRHYLIDAYSAGKSVVLIIDEAQNMPVETLEQLRVLTNLETTKDKLLQVLLVGQPELEDKLGLHQLRQLNQRVAVRATLRHLSDEEAADYVKHRVRHAGGTPETIFAPAALKAIVHHAKGNPRVLNITCDNVLANAFGAQQMPISAKLVKEVIKDIAPQPRRQAPMVEWRSLAPMAAAAAIAVVAGAATLSLWRAEPPAEAAPAVEQGIADAQPQQVASAPQPEQVAAVESPSAPDVPAPTAAREPAEERFDPEAVALQALLDRDRKRREFEPAPPAAAPEEVKAEAPVAEAAPAPAAPAPVEEEPAEVIVASGLLESTASEPVEESTAAPASEPVPLVDGLVAPTPEPAPAPAPEPVNVPESEAPAEAPAPEQPAAIEATPAPVAELEPAPAAEPARDLAGAKSVKIEPGDTLIELLLRRYGRYDTTMIDQVQQLNPSVSDPNHILAGGKLLLPDFDSNAEEAAPGDAPAAGN